MTAKSWKQPRCPYTEENVHNFWCAHAMEYYSAIKMNKPLIPVTWMNPENVNADWKKTFTKVHIVWFHYKVPNTSHQTDLYWKRGKKKKNTEEQLPLAGGPQRDREARREIPEVTMKIYILIGVWVTVFVKTHQAIHFRYKYAQYCMKFCLKNIKDQKQLLNAR